jgi:hypothetical protein
MKKLIIKCSIPKCKSRIELFGKMAILGQDLRYQCENHKKAKVIFKYPVFNTTITTYAKNDAGKGFISLTPTNLI